MAGRRRRPVAGEGWRAALRRSLATLKAGGIGLVVATHDLDLARELAAHRGGVTRALLRRRRDEPAARERLEGIRARLPGTVAAETRISSGPVDRVPVSRYARLVRDVVERYDGDGQNDMPGLLFPVLHYQVGNEYYNELYWGGTADEYGLLLRNFAGAARAARARRARRARPASTR